MARVDLNKHREEMLRAYKEVNDVKNSTNWALFGYEGQTSVLQCMGKGDGGMEELVDELNSARIMYAYCQVQDPNTGLPKFVFINWQGEGCPEIRKGSCANHLRDVQDLFRGYHLNINARSEDEIDEDDIQKKVAKSSGSNYSFHKEAPRKVDEQKGPVGSVYQRTLPQQDIHTNEREKFWETQEKEEKSRQQQETARKRQEQVEIEKERKEQEAESAKARDQREAERLRRIREQKAAEKKANTPERQISKEEWEEQQEQAMREAEERNRRSDQMTKDRAAEARSLIGGRQEQAKAMFESKPRSQFDKPAAAPPPPRKLKQSFVPESSAPAPVAAPRQPIKLPQEEPQAPPRAPAAPAQPPQAEPEQTPVPTTPQNMLAQNLQSHVRRPPSDDEDEDNDAWEDEPQQNIAPTTPSAQTYAPPEDVYDDTTVTQPPDDIYDDTTAMQPPDDVYDDTTITQEPQDVYDDTSGVTAQGGAPPQISAEMGICARALYDYQAAEENEITFDPDDLITNIEMIDDGWWVGVGPDGRNGMFPANYVELINGP